MKEEFENCGVARPSVYLVLKGYSLGKKYLETGNVEVIYYPFAIPDETIEKIKKMQDIGWKLTDGLKEDFSKKEREEIENMKVVLEKTFGKEEAQKKIIEYVRKDIFRWYASNTIKVNYRLSNEMDDLEI